MHIQPNKTDLRKGNPRHNLSCPIARATLRAYRKTFNAKPDAIGVGPDSLTVYHTDHSSRTFTLPNAVANFILNFDTNKAFRAAIRKNYQCRDSARILIDKGFYLPIQPLSNNLVREESPHYRNENQTYWANQYKNIKPEDIVYVLTVGNIQSFAADYLGRPLTQTEIDRIKNSLGGYISTGEHIQDCVDFLNINPHNMIKLALAETPDNTNNIKETPPQYADNDPVFTITVDNVQAAALRKLGRKLENSELDLVSHAFNNGIETGFYLDMAMEDFDSYSVKETAPEYHKNTDKTASALEITEQFICLPAETQLNIVQDLLMHNDDAWHTIALAINTHREQEKELDSLFHRP